MYELGVRSGLAPLTELVAASALIAVSSAPFLVAIPHLVGGEWAHGLALLATGTVTIAIALVAVIAAVSRLGHRHAGTDDPVDTTARSRRREWAHYLSGRSVAYTACLFAWGGTLTGVVVFLLLCGIVGLMVPVASMGDDPVQVLGLDVDGGFRATVSAGVGVLLLLVALRCLASLGRVQARLATTFLVDIATEELFEVTTSRHRMLKGFDAERQRIERDLHDGVQPLLVSVSMKLGLARSLIEPGTPGHADLVAAHTQAKQLMGVMRELVHGIYPRVLAESGLESALRGLAIASVVPTRVRAESLPRCSPDVESVAYFCTSELLTNVNKHSGATEATMSVCVDDGVIVIQIRDNGRGGAMYGLGTGLTGVADRVATVAGNVTLSSPEGGPTEAMLRLPFEGG